MNTSILGWPSTGFPFQLLLSCIILVLPVGLPAQSPAFRHYGTDDGLSRFSGWKRGGLAPFLAGKTGGQRPSLDHIRALYRNAVGSLAADRPWAQTTNRVANYPALEPAPYRFDVQTRDESGRWSASTVLPITIAGPWWYREWVLISGVLLLSGFALAGYKKRTRQLERETVVQRLRDERLQERMEREVEVLRLKQAMLRSQINPHFIFNCLNSLQRYIVEGNREQAVHYLARFAKLTRLTLDFSLEEKISLENDIHLLRTYLGLEKMRYKTSFSYCIEVAAALSPFELEIPPLLLQPYVENALIHGLAHTEHPGEVTIAYRREGSHLVATVTDNGIGIRAARRRHKGRDSLHRSVGMSIPRRRLDLLNPKRQNDSVTIEEITAPDGQVLGTRVTVRIPLEESARPLATVDRSPSLAHRPGVRRAGDPLIEKLCPEQ